MPEQTRGPQGSEAKRSIDALIRESLRYRRSEEFLKLLTFVRHFPAYSPFNGLLVHVQRPGSRYVATAGRWHDRWRQQVRVGAQQLVILQPFGPVLFVVDVSDTDPMPGAKPLPAEIVDPFTVRSRANPAQVEVVLAQTVTNAMRDGVRLHDVAFGAQMAGRILRARTGHAQSVVARLKPSVEYLEVPVRYELEVSAQQSGLSRYATLCHELAHLYCGHLGTPNPRWWLDRRHVDHRTGEFEAECAAAIAVWRLDPTAKMPPYLAQHLASDPDVPKDVSLERVMQVAGLIAEMGTKRLPLRKPA